MFSARDKDRKVLHLLKESSVPKRNYFCPGCGGPVRLKKGKSCSLILHIFLIRLSL